MDGEVADAAIQLRITVMIKKKKYSLAIDFDGVIHAYTRGFSDGTIYDAPTAGAQKALIQLSKKYSLYIYSYRARTKAGHDAIRNYLKKYKIPHGKIVADKPLARFYIDDRAIRFKTWKQALGDISTFEKEFAQRKRS